MNRSYPLIRGLSAGTGKHCVFGGLGLVFIWSCFVFCLLFLLLYVIYAPVPAEAALISCVQTSKIRATFRRQERTGSTVT